MEIPWLMVLNHIKMLRFGKIYIRMLKVHSLTISIDKTTNKNGCLEIVRKKHKLGLLGTNKSAIPKNIVKKLKWEKFLLSLEIL